MDPPRYIVCTFSVYRRERIQVSQRKSIWLFLIDMHLQMWMKFVNYDFWKEASVCLRAYACTCLCSYACACLCARFCACALYPWPLHWWMSTQSSSQTFACSRTFFCAREYSSVSSWVFEVSPMLVTEPCARPAVAKTVSKPARNRFRNIEDWQWRYSRVNYILLFTEFLIVQCICLSD